MNSSVGDLFGGSARKIRDEVWGDIPVNRAMRTLLETKAMQRLKGMRKLGFVTGAFPAARHSRLDHALGVYYLTGITLKRITDSGAYLEERETQSALAAALLLDIGRYPYAEAVEDIALPEIIGQKELSRRWIEDSEVARVLKSEWDVEPHNVSRLVTRDNDLPIALTPTEHLTRDILFGSLDISTLDSLIRDAKGTKVSFGLLNLDGLMENLRIVGQENRALLAVDEDGAGALQAYVFSRYLMYYNVYGHYAMRIPHTMFARAVQDSVQDNIVSFDRLAEEDDAGAFALVQDSAPRESAPAILTRRLAERRPYLRALELDYRHHSYTSLIRLRTDASWRRRVEEAWSRYLTRYRKGVAGPFDILIDIPRPRTPQVDLQYIRRMPLPGERNLTDWEGLSGMHPGLTEELSLPLHRRIRVMAADQELAQSVRRHAEELFTIAKEVG
ncbi:MAG: hypothetical protein ACR2KW_05460 [Rubrobacter sp.]